MKILLDECVDRRLARRITGHEVHTAAQLGWAGVKNGQLLALAAEQFEAFVTVDRNLAFQQNLGNFDLSIIVLRAKTNRLSDLTPLVPQLLAQLDGAPRGAVTLIGEDAE